MKRVGFALEYALGHATHADNLKRTLARGLVPEIEPHYVDLPFDAVAGAWTRLPGVRSNWTLRASIGAYLALRPQIRRLDNLLFHTQITSIFSVGLMKRAPAVVSLDATPIQIDRLGAAYGHIPSANSRVEAIKRRLTLRTFHAARLLVTWSHWAKDSLVRDYGITAEKIRVIPPGIDLDDWPDNSQGKPARAEAADVRLLFVGGDFARKGGDDLLAALAQLPTPLRNHTRLDIVTRAPNVTVPESLSAGRVRIHRNMSANTPELRRLFADADVFVFPTRGDCLPLAVLEALAAGLPVITCPVGALSEPVVDHVTGRLVPPGEPSTLAGVLAEIIDDSALRTRLSINARDAAFARYDASVNYPALARAAAGE